MSAGAMESGWYYSRRGAPQGQQVGPLSWGDLVGNARSGAFAPDDLVWNQAMGDWRPASQIPGLFEAPAAAPAYAAQPAYAAPAYGAAPAAKSKLLYWLIPVIVVVLAGIGLGVYFLAFYNKSDEFAQGEGEILLEASGVAGPDSFAGEQFVATGPSTTLKIPNPQVTLPQVTTTVAQTTTTAAQTTTTGKATTTTMPPTVLVAYPGDTPALYGGSKDKLVSDKEKELAFLEQNPAKAAAFCEALNSDPTLRWSGGNKVSPSQLRAYFAELTPMLLTRDTRVTNFGYKNGKPTPRQSVLQAGQLVLVDQYGVPRKRCECGNPLTPPKPSKRPPIYTGPKWPGFDPTTIIVIQQTTVVINIFVVIDVNTGETYTRPPGSEGGTDGPGTDGTTTTETTSTTLPPSTDTTGTTVPPSTDTTTGGPVDANAMNGPWSGTMTITELTLDPAVQQAAEQQGCTPQVLEAMKNMPLPMEMTITMDPGGKGGTAVMTLDSSGLGGTSSSDTPQSFTFTMSGNSLTFQIPAEAGSTGSMTATVGWQGQTLVMSGSMDQSGQGVTMKAVWTLNKQVGM